MLRNSFFKRNNILNGMLFGSEALLKLREDMMLAISFLSVGCRNVVLLLSFEKCLCEYFVLFL